MTTNGTGAPKRSHGFMLNRYADGRFPWSDPLNSSMLFWPLFVPLLPQALWVRATAPRFPGADGPRTGTVGDGATKRLLAVGDSIVAGVGARTLDRALVGQTASALAESMSCRIDWSAIGRVGYPCARVEALVPTDAGHCDFVLVSAGVNDIISLNGEAQFRADLRSLYQALAHHAPSAAIGFCGIPPLGQFPALPQPLRAVFGLRAARFDRILRDTLADLPRASRIPVELQANPDAFSPDGFHPSESSYIAFGRAAAEALMAQRREFR